MSEKKQYNSLYNQLVTKQNQLEAAKIALEKHDKIEADLSGLIHSGLPFVPQNSNRHEKLADLELAQSEFNVASKNIDLFSEKDAFFEQVLAKEAEIKQLTLEQGEAKQIAFDLHHAGLPPLGSISPVQEKLYRLGVEIAELQSKFIK